MNILFAGTPEFAVPTLSTLLDTGHDLIAVYTQPDRPAGRGRKLQASPIKKLAQHHDLNICQPATLRDQHAQTQLDRFAPDLMVVVAYGLLLPPDVLNVPTRGCVNIHASLLPHWRGAAPIQHALLAGDSNTGITLMQMDQGLDTGGILAQAKCPIRNTDTATDLHNRLAALGAELLKDNLEALLAGTLRPRSQDHGQATYASKISKKDARVDWTLAAGYLDRMVRAFNPWPVAYTGFAGQPLRIWQAQPLESTASGAPGTVIKADHEGIDVVCGAGVLRLLEVQLPGGRRISASEFINAHSLHGVRFSSIS